MLRSSVKHPEVIIPAPHLRLVDQDIFTAVSAVEIKSHKRKPLKIKRLLDGKLICSHCGRPMILRLSGAAHTYACDRNNRPEKGGQRLNSLSIEETEAAVIQGLRELLDRGVYDQEFSEKYAAEIDRYEHELRERVQDLKRSAVKNRSNYDTALTALLGPLPPAVFKDLQDKIGSMHDQALEADAAVESAEADLAALRIERKMSQERSGQISKFLADVDIQHPWQPSLREEKDAFDELRASIKCIVLTDLGQSAKLDIEFVLFRVANADEAGEDEVEQPDVVEITRKVTIEDPALFYQKSNRIRKILQAKIAFENSTRKMTDEEWYSLPEMSVMFGKGDQLRFFIDALIVAERSKHSVTDFLWAFDLEGERLRFDTLRQMGGIPIVVEHLRKTRGKNFTLMEPAVRQSSSVRNTFLNARDPLLLLDVCDPMSGKTEMDERQQAIVLEICNQSHQIAQGPDIIRMIDGYFSLIREGLPAVRGYQVGIERKEFRKLLVLRKEMSDLTRRLLELQGYALPLSYMRPKQECYTVKKVDDPDKIILEMEAGLPRGPVPGDADPIVIRVDGFSINLTTGEFLDIDGNNVDIGLNRKLMLLCLLRNAGSVVTIGTLEAAMIPWGNKPNHPRQAINKLVRWLIEECPTLGGSIKNVYGKGYQYTPSA